MNAEAYPRDPPKNPWSLLLDKMDDNAKGEMERRGGVMFLPVGGLFMALMFGEDDLLRINRDKDDMVITMIRSNFII